MLALYNIVYSLKESSEDLLWFWKQKSAQNTNLCCEKLCKNSDVQGTLVYCYKSQKQYLIPLCEAHSNLDTEIYIPDFFKLVEV